MITAMFFLIALNSNAQKTYCNPLNLDYAFTPIPGAAKWGAHRATADPVIVTYKNEYYLFSTNQWGYWVSDDLLDWDFKPKKFLRDWNKSYDELCAPAVGIIGDTMIVFGSTYTNNFTLWMSTDPKANIWKPLVDSFTIGGWDPAFFTDDDGRFYMYNGSSNTWPLYGVELDRKTFEPKTTRKEMYGLQAWRYGWQRFGEHLDNTFLDPFIEGAWMTKHNDKYYLQYGAPGTEFSWYADGVVESNSPLGPFTAVSDPMSAKPGGFARGAGHGATFQDRWNNYWHTSTIRLSTKNNFERRIGLWPAGFDQDGVMYCNTTFGDYPHFLPDDSTDHLESQFTGWMLLNYQKPVTVSSYLSGHPANYAVDENLSTYWSTASAEPGEWLTTDLGENSMVYAIQVNYADEQVDKSYLGRQDGLYHQYKLYHSENGKDWKLLIDKSKNQTDVPHDYVQLEKPVMTRYIKIENIHMAAGLFAISGIRVFGKGNGKLPEPVEDLIILRTEKDKRDAWIKWKPVSNAYAYNIHYGTHPNKLYTCIMVHDENQYWCKSLDSQMSYYFTIEAINENGVSGRSGVIKVE